MSGGVVERTTETPRGPFDGPSPILLQRNPSTSSAVPTPSPGHAAPVFTPSSFHVNSVVGTPGTSSSRGLSVRFDAAATSSAGLRSLVEGKTEGDKGTSDVLESERKRPRTSTSVTISDSSPVSLRFGISDHIQNVVIASCS